MSDKPKKKKYEKRIPKPTWVRTNDYKRVDGANYIIRRNEFNAATYVIGKSYRKLSTQVEVEYHLQQGKKVAMWAGKYFLWTRVSAEIGRQVLERIWEMEEKRGIPRPEVSDYDKDAFDI